MPASEQYRRQAALLIRVLPFVREEACFASWWASSFRAVQVNGELMTILSAGDRSRLSALIAAPEYLERQWMGRLRPLLNRQHVESRCASAPRGRPRMKAAGRPWTPSLVEVERKDSGWRSESATESLARGGAESDTETNRPSTYPLACSSFQPQLASLIS